jgi:hypothetical protein
MSACQTEPHATAHPRRQWPLDSVTPLMAALPTVPAMSRAFVRSTLCEWHLESLSEGAELVASELTSNAVAASTDDTGRPAYVNGRMPCVRVALLSDGSRVMLEVWDQAPGTPEVRAAVDYDEGGRGLVLVDAIAVRWGWCPATGPGKVVWAELSF